MESNPSISTQSGREKACLARQTQFDLKSMILGFHGYCMDILSRFPGMSVSSLHVNQDWLENFFGQQRAQHGQNKNPTISQYGKLRINLF